MTEPTLVEFSPTREFLVDLGDRLERISDGEEGVPIGPDDIFTLRMALKLLLGTIDRQAYPIDIRMGSPRRHRKPPARRRSRQ
jgi:hypothetical protein